MRGRKAGLADLARLLKRAQSRRAQAEKAESEQAEGRRLTRVAAAQEAAVFRRAMQTVTPLKSPLRREGNPPLALSSSSSALRRAAAAGETGLRADAAVVSDGGSELNYLLSEGDTVFVRAHMAPDIARKLRRGHWRTGAELDLHGQRSEQARHAVLSFIRDCLEHSVRCVRIIHGKGYGSPDLQPVLKNKVRAWLIQVPQVQAFVEAPKEAGGSGALLVLLKQTEKGGG